MPDEDTLPWSDGTLYEDDRGTYDDNGDLIEDAGNESGDDDGS